MPKTMKMIQNSFQKRKLESLNKEDKSSKARQSLSLNRPGDADPKEHWDERISELCDKINRLENYYTTSSCSGRVVVLNDKEKKEPGMFYFVSHDLIDFEELKKQLDRITGENVKFKQEPCILHVACNSLKDSEELLKKAQLSGWKRSGIIASEDRIVCELISTEKLEFPVIVDGKLVVGDEFLNAVVEKSNENLERTWLKIGKLNELF